MRKEIIDNIHEEMCNPQSAMVYSQILKRMRSGFYTDIDIILQKWEKFGSYTLEDAYCFGQIHCLQLNGQIAACDILVGKEPGADEDIHGNNRAVLKSLSNGFKGEFQGGPGDNDGVVEVTKPTLFGVCNVIDGQYQWSNYTISNWSFPLEVGYTSGDTTILHLMESRGIARWPYGDKCIHLLRLIDDRIWSVDFDIERRTPTRQYSFAF